MDAATRLEIRKHGNIPLTSIVFYVISEHGTKQYESILET